MCKSVIRRLRPIFTAGRSPSRPGGWRSRPAAPCSSSSARRSSWSRRRASRRAREGIDFFPLTCDYVEKTFAAGKIPGGFFKREGRPAEKEILTSRLIDRPIRPLFPKGFRCETQVIATVLSHDRENDPDVLALARRVDGARRSPTSPGTARSPPCASGASAASSSINPTDEPARGQRPEPHRRRQPRRDRHGRGRRRMLPEAVLLEALFAAHEALQPLLELQEELRGARRQAEADGRRRRRVDAALEARGARARAAEAAGGARRQPGKQERYAALDAAHGRGGGARSAADDPSRRKAGRRTSSTS